MALPPLRRRPANHPATSLAPTRKRFHLLKWILLAASAAFLAWAALHLHKEPSLEQRYISQISQLKYSYYGFSAYAEANNGRCPDSLGQLVDSRLLKYRGVPEVDMLNALEGYSPNNISGHEPRDKKGCALFYFRFESMNRDSDDILIAVCARYFLSGEPYRLVLKMNGKAEFISEGEFLLWVRQFNMLGDRDGKAKGNTAIPQP